MRSVRSISRKLFLMFAVLSSKKLAACNPITNSDLNDSIRALASKNDSNTSGIKTLQKEDSARYANFSPVRNPVRFKDVPDSAVSSSSYSRGLLHHEHPGYTLHDYEENPIYGYEYHDHGPHGYDHHAPDHHEHHGGHHHINYHHKHYDHGLAAKAFLWPIAGIALLGAAAALVSNPVLLQLGVVSGRRKRRDTEETFDTQANSELSWLDRKDQELFKDESKVTRRFKNKTGLQQSDEINFAYTGKFDDDEKHNGPINKYVVKKEALFKMFRVLPTVQSPVEVVMDNPSSKLFSASKHVNKNKLIQVPLILKQKL